MSSVPPSSVQDVANRLAGLVVLAATEEERDRILSATTRRLHVVVLRIETTA